MNAICHVHNRNTAEKETYARQTKQNALMEPIHSRTKTRNAQIVICSFSPPRLPSPRKKNGLHCPSRSQSQQLECKWFKTIFTRKIHWANVLHEDFPSEIPFHVCSRHHIIDKQTSSKWMRYAFVESVIFMFSETSVFFFNFSFDLLI